MNDIANKLIVLKLNKNWQAVGYSIVSKAIIDLCAGEALEALDIDYARDKDGVPDFTKPTVMRPVEWDEWITLPIREWDLEIHSPSTTIRVPTVTIAKHYAKMPVRHFNGRPSKQAIWIRDKGICQYTGQTLREEEASLDHVVPVSRGGKSSWTNLVLANKKINWKKGNKLLSESGLILLHEPKAPNPIAVSALIKEAKHVDWSHFLIK